MQNLGLISLNSNYNPGGHLQGTTGGDAWVHASNSGVNEEETWFLFQIDVNAHTYALEVWRSGKFLSRHGGGSTNHRVQANAGGIGPNETWKLVKGDPWGRPGSVALQSVVDSTWLLTNSPGNNAAGENGEVYVEIDNGPASGAGWPGWWYIEGRPVPSPGHDVWNTIGGAVAGVVNKVSAADIAALIAAL